MSYTRIPSAFDGPRDPNAVPVLFQVVSPDYNRLLLPDFMYLHVNPDNMSFSYSKVKAVIQTYGGYVEQHFGEELVSISASQSTGAFVSVEDGVTTYNRRNTVAYRKMLQLIDLFKSNGSVYDDKGAVKFRGRIRIVFGEGTYDGYFTDISIDENAENPYALSVSWSFKVEKEVYSLLY